MLSHIYSKSYIQKSPAMQKITRRLLFERFLPRLARTANEVDVTATVEGNTELQQRRLQQHLSRPVDVLNLFSAITMDFVSAYQFGMANGTNMSGQELGSGTFNESPAGIGSEEFFDLYRSRHAHTFWPQEHPRLTQFLRFIGIRLVPRFVDNANARIEDMIIRMCDAAAAAAAIINVSNEKDELSDRKEYERIEDTPVVYTQLSESLARNNALAKQIEPDNSEHQNRKMASELLDHLAAGFETSGITLAYAAYELSRHPEIQAELRNELRSLGSSTQYPLTSYFTSEHTTIKSSSFSSSSPALPSIPDAKLIDELPLLHAVLLETLRLHSAIPGPQPRVTPSPSNSMFFKNQGSTKNLSAKATATATTTSKLTTLAGHDNIPGGVRVSAQAYSLHRNADVFPDPESWLPHRWLTSFAVDDQGHKLYRLRGSKGKSNNEDGQSGNNNDATKEVNNDSNKNENSSTKNTKEDTAIKEMYRWFWAFGSGGRLCVGSNLAMYRMLFPFFFSSLTFFFFLFLYFCNPLQRKNCFISFLFFLNLKKFVC